jgi:arabinogalactan endo-1,4-beta-galactosidase
MKILKSTSVFFFFLAFPALLFSQNLPFNNDYAFGLDVSFVKQREDNGEKYMDTDSIVKPCLQIFREHGYNWGRIMICNEPTSSRLPQKLQYVISAAQDLKKNGYRFLLDYMMSNGWANPMVQPVPSLWKDMSHQEKVNAVYNYVRETMNALKEAGVMPEIVQVGNEIGNGMLWPDGRIHYDSLEQGKWKNLAEYLNAGIRAIREVETGGKKVRVMLHVDHVETSL